MILTFNLLTFILFTIPLSIVTGPFLPDLSIIFAFFLYLYLLIKKKFELKLSLYLIISFAFFVLILLSFLYSYSDKTISGGYLFYFRFSLLGLMIFSILKHNDNLLYLLYPFLSLVLFVVSCDAIFQYMTGFNFLGYEDLVENRISGFFKTEYILGKYLFLLQLFISTFILNLKKGIDIFFILIFV